MIVCVFLVISGSMLSHEGFAIYLTEKDVPPAQIPALGQVDISERPIIAMDDIIAYNAQTHELRLTESTYENISELEVPVSGRSFVVCVDRRPVYWGAFWTPISSISFEGVTIWKPSKSQGPDIVTLELGYPSSSFYEGGDPRGDPEILRSLEKAGKLIAELSIAEVDVLPQSMKGYELYSWLQDGHWHFTLITGTNRNKTLEEVVSSEDFISEAGWVVIHVVGADAIKTALGKLHEGEHIVWLAGMRGQTSEGNVSITLPEGPDVSSISEYAQQCSLDLYVQASSS